MSFPLFTFVKPFVYFVVKNVMRLTTKGTKGFTKIHEGKNNFHEK